MFTGCTLLPGPKHSTSIPSSAGFAVPLRVDEKKVVFVPNPVPGLAMKASFCPQMEENVDVCSRVHSVLRPILQVLTPLMFPKTVQLKVKVP